MDLVETDEDSGSQARWASWPYPIPGFLFFLFGGYDSTSGVEAWVCGSVTCVSIAVRA